MAKRLRPLTNNTPKCLIPIKGVPIIDIWINKLIKSGINKIFINTHYLHHKIEKHFQKHNYKNNIEIFYEKEILGTAKSVYEITKNIEDDFLVAHSDNFFLEDLNNLKNSFHKRPKNCVATLMSFKVKKSINYGTLKIDKNNIMTDYFEKKDVKLYDANCATYIFSKNFFKYYLKESDIDLSLDVIPRLINRSNVFFTKKLFVDIGTHESLRLLN